MRAATEFLNNVAFGTGDGTLGTSPSTGVLIVRCFNITNVAASPGTFNLALRAGATSATAANDDFYQVTVPANTTQPFYGYWVLPASTAVHGMASAITMHIDMDGDLAIAGG